MMNSPADDRLAALFDALVDLDPPARARALDDAGLEPAQRAALEQLLAADRSKDTRLEHALAGPAQRAYAHSGLLPGRGARIGAWQVLRELGSGGMGTVFLVQRADAGDAQRGALKLLRGFPTREGHDRLRQERRVLATLEHPYIARLIDGGETTDGQPYFVMEYVDGEPATTFAARRGLDAAARVALVDRIAEAVAHAHQRLVIHRDLKPTNVLVRDDGTPRVLDFGVAKLMDEAGDTGGTSTRVWTPGYASPEQTAGRAVTTATDVYALGALLRELLSGRRPDGSECEPALAAVPVDADLQAILAKASADDASERYPTVEALRDDLARWRDGRPVRAKRDTSLYRAGKFLRRHRGGVGLVVLVLLALVAFMWRLGVERNRALEAEALAEQRRVAAEQSAATAVGALDFFAGVLAEVAPERAESRSITVDDWLDRAALRLTREPAGDAQEVALLGGYLGALHGSLGNAELAIERLEPALAAMEARGLDRGVLFAGMASTLAGQMLNAGRLQDAAMWSRRAAEAWGALGQGGDRVAPIHAALAVGYAHYVLGEFEPAIAAYREALALSDPMKGEAPVLELRIETTYMLGGALKELGRQQEALSPLDAALAEAGAGGYGRSAGAVRLHRTRSEVLGALGRSAEALAAIDRALEVEREVFGQRGALYANLINQRGTTLNELGRYREAREALVEAQRSTRAASGIDDPAVRLNLANVCDSIGDNDCARAEYEALLADTAAMQAFLPPNRRQVRQMLGRALSQAGDYDHARTVLETLLPEAITEDGAASPNAAAILIHLARNEQRDRRWDAALDYAKRTREAYAALVPEGHYIFATLDRIEGFVALGQGRLDAAARLIEGYRDATVAGDGAESLWAALADLDVAQLRHAQGRDDEARALLRQHLPKVRDTLLPTHPDRAAAEALAKTLQIE
jgi:serine/threonine-protein kinase